MSSEHRDVDVRRDAATGRPEVLEAVGQVARCTAGEVSRGGADDQLVELAGVDARGARRRARSAPESRLATSGRSAAVRRAQRDASGSSPRSPGRGGIGRVKVGRPPRARSATGCGQRRHRPGAVGDHEDRAWSCRSARRHLSRRPGGERSWRTDRCAHTSIRATATTWPRATSPAMLHIAHHERVEGHPHRWRVFRHGRGRRDPGRVDPGDARPRADGRRDRRSAADRAGTARQRETATTCSRREETTTRSWDAPVASCR